MRKLKQEVWPFQITIMSNNDSIDDWCRENIGRRFRDWYGYYATEGRIYAFKEAADLIVFKLRWSYNG